MDLSALIFVALAVAWAVYLIPKALKHDEDSQRGRAVDGFSHTLRVLARREPVDSRKARLVVTPGKPAVDAVVVEDVAPPTPAQLRVRRKAAAQAAKRRLRVVVVILFAAAVVGVLAGLRIIDWAYIAIPAVALTTWLVACRLMVRKERGVAVRRPHTVVPADPAQPESEIAVDPVTEDIPAVAVSADAQAPVVAEEAVPADEPAVEPAVEAAQGWDPVPVTLPTYVSKPPASRRSVRTIDLDSTGVWSSGFNAGDSQLAREAEEVERAAKAAKTTESDAERRRASGS